MSPRDHTRARLIWASTLEALDDDSLNAMKAVHEHAHATEDPADELLLLFTTTAGLLAQHLDGSLGGSDKAREYIHHMLFDNDLTQESER